MEFKQFKKQVEVNGLQVEVDIKIEVTEDDANILLDQDFENDAEKQAYIRKLNNEELFAGYVVVTVSALGVEGFDSLGGCELTPNNMFNSDPFNASVEVYLNEYAMVANAINDFKANLQMEYRRLIQKADETFTLAQTFLPYAKKEY